MPANTAAHLLTQVMLATFRVNGDLLEAGDRLVAGLHLTSSRWQVLGALASHPATASQIARVMGLTRQSVQRTINALESENFVSFEHNPNHANAPLVALTNKGETALEKATAMQINWSRSLASAHSEQELRSTLATLEKLSASLRGRLNTEKVGQNETKQHSKAGKSSRPLYRSRSKS